MASDDYEALFIGDFNVVKSDVHQPWRTVTIKFDVHRNGYIALQSPGQDGYTSVHLWACKSFDARSDEHDIRQVRCGGDDGHEYWFNETAASAGGENSRRTVDLAIGRGLWRHYLLTRTTPAS